MTRARPLPTNCRSSRAVHTLTFQTLRHGGKGLQSSLQPFRVFEMRNSPRIVLVDCNVGSWQILLQKSLAISTNSDSLAPMRFVPEANNDGAAETRARAILFFLSRRCCS